MSERRQGRLRALGAALSLGLFTFALNFNALNAFFVGDDFDFLRVMRRVKGFGDALKMQFWGEWEPVWWMTWYADYRLWRFQPLGYHLTNVFWLAVGVVALFALVRTIWPGARLAAWAAALLFLTHPLHDEAVTYLAARGHVMSVALALVAVVLYARWRIPARSGTSRLWLPAVAMLAAFLAALAKETALVLPVWIAVLECAVVDPSVGPGQARSRRPLIRGLGAGALFLIPAVGTLLLRNALVGVESSKLKGAFGTLGSLGERVVGDLPGYALMGGLPLPFGFVDYPVIERWEPLGWVLLAAVVGLGIAVVARLARGHRVSIERGVCLFGLCIAASGFAPVFWADLGLRRRYLFMPSVGIVLIAVVVLHWIACRYRRAGPVLLALLVVGGALGTVQRNELYRRSGEVSRNLIETARGAAIGQSVHWAGRFPPQIALATLPRYYGGDFLSGAYLLHHTDIFSGLGVFAVPQRRVHVAMKTEHAEDYHTEVVSGEGTRIRIRVSFRTRRAFDAARRRDPDDDRRGDRVSASLRSVDAASRSLTYDLDVEPRFWLRPDSRLLVYSDGRFRAIPPS